MQKNVIDIESAVALRKENKSIKEISEKLNKSKSTVKRWLAPYSITMSPEVRKFNALKGSLKMKEMYALKRKEAYDSVQSKIQEDLNDRILRDFINIYIGEGSKRRDTEIAVTNSDPKIILLSLFIMKKFFLKENKKINLEVRYYKENNNELELLEYWRNLVNDESVKFTTYIQTTVKAEGHNNSNKYGLIVLTINDTYAKQKLNAYMDYVKEEWTKQFEETFNTKFIERE